MTKQSLKVSIIGPAHPFRGGIALGNERLAEEFRKFGHDVKIETFSVQYPNFLFPGKTQYTETEKPLHLNIKRTINSINPLNWIKVGLRIKKEKRDIVIFRFWLPFMGPCFGTIARFIRQNKYSKIITVLDNVIPHEHRIGDKLFTKYFIKPNHGFISMSKKVQNDLLSYTSNHNYAYSPHPLFDNFGKTYSKEEACKALKLDPNYNYILFFGLIRDYKGLDLLLNAFSKINYTDLKIKLLIAGEYYSDEQKYTDLINELEINESIISIKKFIKDADVGYYFSAADIVAQPYKNATQSGVTQIAYHFNSPLLVTNVGGLPEMVPHNKVGYVVEKDPTQIADALTDFFVNERADQFKNNFQFEKDKYTWDKMVNNIINLSIK